MQADKIGQILEGRVTRIVDYGAFISLPDNECGMVHVSEVAPVFVKDINNFLKVGSTVKVKVIDIQENGRISLSVKKALEIQENNIEKEEKKSFNNNFKEKIKEINKTENNGFNKEFKNNNLKEYERKDTWQGVKKNASPVTLDDKLNKLRQVGEENAFILKNRSGNSGKKSRKAKKNK